MTDNEREAINGDKVTITVSLTQYVDSVIEKTIDRLLPKAIAEFQKICPTAKLHEQIVEDHNRFEKLRFKIAIIVGAVIGSGILGGVASATVIKLFS